MFLLDTLFQCGVKLALPEGYHPRKIPLGVLGLSSMVYKKMYKTMLMKNIKNCSEIVFKFLNFSKYESTTPRCPPWAKILRLFKEKPPKSGTQGHSSAASQPSKFFGPSSSLHPLFSFSPKTFFCRF